MDNLIGTPNLVDAVVQPSDWDTIADLDTTNFTKSGKNFIIKNENDTNITLAVTPARGTDGVFVDTVFYPGWNLELVKAIEANETYYENIKWGL